MLTEKQRYILTKLIAFPFCGAVLLAQNVTVITGEWNGSGISLTQGMGNPGFADLVTAASAMSGVGLDASPLYPYSFILTNNSGHSIVAFSARWSATDSTGRTTTHDNQSAFTHFDASNGIAAGQLWLVTPVTALNSATTPPSRLLSGLSTEISAVQRSLAASTVITITLESAVLDNGLILGEDRNNGIAQLRARIDARHQLAAGVLNAFNMGGQTAAMSYLQAVAGTPQAGDAISASRQTTPDAAYGTFLSLTETRLAQSYLVLARDNPSLLISIAHKDSEQQVPTLHR